MPRFSTPRRVWAMLLYAWAMMCLGAPAASAAAVSLKAFDRLARQMELAYVRAGTSEIERVPMQQTVPGIWQADVHVPAGDYEYRFVADGEWISDVGNPRFNRWDDGSVWSQFSVPGETDAFANYRRTEPSPAAEPVPAAAAAAGESAPPENADGQIAVRFRFYAPLAKEAAVVGTFNDWNGERNRMARGEGGIWECTLPLDEGISRSTPASRPLTRSTIAPQSVIT